MHRLFTILLLSVAIIGNTQSWTPSKMLADTVPKILGDTIHSDYLSGGFALDNFKIMDYKSDSNYCAVTLLFPDSTIQIEGDTMRCIKMLLVALLERMRPFVGSSGLGPDRTIDIDPHEYPSSLYGQLFHPINTDTLVRKKKWGSRL